MRKNETQLVCIAEFIAKEGEEQALMENLLSLMEMTHQEGGCIRYELNQSLDNPRKLTYIEKWYDQKTFDAHCAKPYITGFFSGGSPDHVETSEVTLHKELLP